MNRVWETPGLCRALRILLPGDHSGAGGGIEGPFPIPNVNHLLQTSRPDSLLENTPGCSSQSEELTHPVVSFPWLCFLSRSFMARPCLRCVCPCASGWLPRRGQPKHAMWGRRQAVTEGSQGATRFALGFERPWQSPRRYNKALEGFRSVRKRKRPERTGGVVSPETHWGAAESSVGWLFAGSRERRRQGLRAWQPRRETNRGRARWCWVSSGRWAPEPPLSVFSMFNLREPGRMGLSCWGVA